MNKIKCISGLGLLVIISLLLKACSDTAFSKPEQLATTRLFVPPGSYTTRITSDNLYPDQLSLAEYLGVWEFVFVNNNMIQKLFEI